MLQNSYLIMKSNAYPSPPHFSRKSWASPSMIFSKISTPTLYKLGGFTLCRSHVCSSQFFPFRLEQTRFLCSYFLCNLYKLVWTEFYKKHINMKPIWKRIVIAPDWPSHLFYSKLVQISIKMISIFPREPAPAQPTNKPTSSQPTSYPQKKEWNLVTPHSHQDAQRNFQR